MTWKTVNTFSEALKEACNKSLKIGRAFMKKRKQNGNLVDRGTNSEKTSKRVQKEISKDQKRQPTRPTPNRIPSRKGSISSKNKES